MLWRAALLVATITLGGGCLGVFADDGGSVSVGLHGHGALLRGVRVPTQGMGYAVPEPLRAREAVFATREMAALVRRSFAAVASQIPDARTALGDISRRGGGRNPGHGSHQSGRDVDIFFFARTSAGEAWFPDRAMLRFGADGWARRWSPPHEQRAPHTRVPDVYFDTRANWLLVRALLTDPAGEVQWIFIHRALAARLLAFARDTGEDTAVVARAEALFSQPGDGDPHDDHMHVRLFCDPADRDRGCVDKGPQRWLKKHWKYLPEGDAGDAPAPLVSRL